MCSQFKDGMTKLNVSISLAYTKHMLSICYTGISTYVYAFLNIETTESYYIMFIRIFKVLAQVSRRPIRWGYIHKTQDAIQAVTLDMCRKQAKGVV
jgi:hypothetical protein